MTKQVSSGMQRHSLRFNKYFLRYYYIAGIFVENENKVVSKAGKVPTKWIIYSRDRRQENHQWEIVMDKRENNLSSFLMMKILIPRALPQIMAVPNILILFMTI